MIRVTINALSTTDAAAMANLIWMLGEWRRTRPDLRVKVLVSAPSAAFTLRHAGFGDAVHMLPRKSGLARWLWTKLHLQGLLKQLGTEVYLSVPREPISDRPEAIPAVPMRPAAVLPAA